MTSLFGCNTIAPNTQPDHPPSESTSIKIGPSFWIQQSQHTPAADPRLKHPFSFKVSELPANYLLDIMAGELKLGYDTDTCGELPVSLSGQKMTMAEVIDRIQTQTHTTLTLTQRTLSLRCQKPEMRIYSLDYLAIERQVTDTSTLNSTLGNPDHRENALPRNNTNQSELVMNSAQKNQVWSRIQSQIEQLVAEEPLSSVVSTRSRTMDENTDRAGLHTTPSKQQRNNSLSQQNRTLTDVTVTRKESSSGQVVVSPEAATLAVLATPAAHQRVEQWLNHMEQRLNRQIVLEAVIAEITLNQRYEKGIDWNLIRQGSLQAGLKIQGNLLADPGFILNLGKNNSSSSIQTILSLLQEFGHTSVISSPRVSAMNQQPAVLKVVDNRVYFTTDVQTSAPTQNNPAWSTYSTHIQTVPVGFLMTVTPQISDSGVIALRVRPTLSRIVGFVNDPNPALRERDIINQVPEVQTRELESILRLRNGEMAVLGGLKQREIKTLNRSLPGLNEALNPLTSSQKNSEHDIELVILLTARTLETEPGNTTPNSTYSNPEQQQQTQQLNAGLQEGLALWHAGQLKAAIIQQERLSQQFSNAPEPRFNLALLHAYSGDYEESQQQLNQTDQQCQRMQCHFSTHMVHALLQGERP